MSERISAKTGMIAVIGDPIRHSKSPVIHNESCAKLGIDYVDVAIQANHDNIEDVVKGLKALNYRGWNITTPCKEDMMKLCDELTTEGKLIEAVNTVIHEDGKLKGTSTDGIGFMASLKDGNLDLIGKKMTMIGCGGAAIAILVQAAVDGVKEISVFNRRNGKHWDKASQKVKEIREVTGCNINLYDLNDLKVLRREIYDSYLLVNGTSVGMGNQEGLMPIPDETFLHPDLNVYDVIYYPRVTRLLETAKKVGCPVVMNGESLLVYQAAASFKLWFDQEMPVDYIKKLINIDPIIQ